MYSIVCIDDTAEMLSSAKKNDSTRLYQSCLLPKTIISQIRNTS